MPKIAKRKLPVLKHKRRGDPALPSKYLTGPHLHARYAITEMTLWRWMQDPVIKFPQPSLMVWRHRFWDEAVLREWELQQVRAANPSEAA